MKLSEYLHLLQTNNNRPWFQQHRELFDQVRAPWLEQLQRFINAMSLWEPDLSTVTAAASAYRIYRDTRFSSDKTPYKTYFSAMISPYGRKTKRAGYYLHIDARPDESGLYGGMWCPDSEMLAKERRAIVDNIEEWEGIVNAPDLREWRWVGNALKTVPKGYDKAHPQARWLRLKDYGLWLPAKLEDFDRPDWPERFAERFAAVKPMVDFLNYSLDEEEPFTLPFL